MDVRTRPALVLVVEDDARSARALARLLKQDGYEVETAFDGAAAICRLAADPCPDILVVDYMLPHLDGLGVASFARMRSPSIHVVIVTGYHELVRRRPERLDPPAVLLPKPLIYEDLTGELTRLGVQP